MVQVNKLGVVENVMPFKFELNVGTYASANGEWRMGANGEWEMGKMKHGEHRERKLHDNHG